MCADGDVVKQDLTPMDTCALRFALRHGKSHRTGGDVAKQDLTPMDVYSLKAIGTHFGLHYATVSRIARMEMW
jgi:hypothetical protein